MTCRTLGNATVCGDQMEKVRDDVDGDPRWCFRCRQVREFRFVVLRPVGISYYGPNPAIQCGVCRLSDGDLFPGGFREWEED